MMPAVKRMEAMSGVAVKLGRIKRGFRHGLVASEIFHQACS